MLKTSSFEQIAQKVESYLNNQASFQGFCIHCDEIIEFNISHAKVGEWTDLRERFRADAR